MKKIFTILTLTVIIWGCAKKMAPAKATVLSSNTGSVIAKNSETPATISTTTEINATPQTATPATFTTAAPNAEIKIVKAGTQTPEVMAQIAGQSTYNAKCGTCHGLKVTTDYTSDRWVSIMAVMANGSHANLNDTQKDNVLAYVRANSKK